MQPLFDFKIVNSLTCLNPGNDTFHTPTQLPDTTTLVTLVILPLHTASLLKLSAFCRKRKSVNWKKKLPNT